MHFQLQELYGNSSSALTSGVVGLLVVLQVESGQGETEKASESSWNHVPIRVECEKTQGVLQSSGGRWMVFGKKFSGRKKTARAKRKKRKIQMKTKNGAFLNNSTTPTDTHKAVGIKKERPQSQ